MSLGGCAQTARSPASTVSQKQPIRQTPSYAGSVETLSVAPPPAPVLPFMPVQPVKIKAGILLPLTGKNAALGQAMLNASQQAVFDAAGNNFELQPHDTAAPGGAEEAARAAAADGAQIIIGPLFATDIPSAIPIAQMNGLQMLTLSTDTSLSQQGVYVMGLAPTQQVDRVVDYAIKHGAHTFAALIPSTPYGAVVGQAFHNAVESRGGTVIDYEIYNSVSPEALDRAKALVSMRDRIDALFLPESGGDLKAIADQLSAVGFNGTHMHILGTGLWDVPGLGQQNPLLVGGWYAAPDPAMRRNFVAGYAAAYGQDPPRLATLAYDATALAAVIAKHGARYDEVSLTNPNGFAGLDGIFRLTANGEVERALAVNEVLVGGAHVIDPAPVSFVTKK